MAGLYGQSLMDYIVQDAKRFGVDPAAVLSVANVEGQYSGKVGDRGTSFGPFQLHIGGLMPAGKPGSWANTPAGIDYAMQKIAGVARGLTGKSSVTAIVTKFERPAKPATEVANAMAGYTAQESQLARSNTGPSVVVATQTSAVNPSQYGLSGGNGKPYTLSLDTIMHNSFWGTQWAEFISMFGSDAAKANAQSYVDTFNQNSKSMATKYGVNSSQYKDWLNKVLPTVSAAKSDAYKAPSVTDVLSQFTVLLKQGTWLRVGEGILGGVLIVFGIYLLAKELGAPVPNVKSIAKTAGLAAML
jgi:hypothetical protein